MSFHAKALGGDGAGGGPGEPVRLRIGLLDGKRRLILQRPLAVPADGKWHAVDLALVHRCTPAVYRWAPAHALTDAA